MIISEKQGIFSNLLQHFVKVHLSNIKVNFLTIFYSSSTEKMHLSSKIKLLIQGLHIKIENTDYDEKTKFFQDRNKNKMKTTPHIFIIS